MKRTRSRRYSPLTIAGLTALAVVACSLTGSGPDTAFAAESSAVSAGALMSLDDDGQPGATCPLEHTDVNAEISGPLARVTVTQQFHNQFPDTIEAVYVFPLPQNAAVDDMTMKVGDRTIKGKIKRRDEARAIYEAAKASGHMASLLDQERPNIFTQSVANIPPGARVEIEISYVETLSYEEGRYEFSFPMVVGPRYIPGSPGDKTGGGWAPDTDQVPDASHITPPVTKPGTRAGHDISLAVKLDAGVPVSNITSKLHDVDVRRDGDRAEIRLKQEREIPNKDFILNYQVAGEKIGDAVLAHHDERGGFFTLILQPPERVTVEDVTPKELVFVLDTSGSMSGFPIEKAKEVIQLAIDGLYPRDTFNLITFAGSTQVLFSAPVPATNENIRKAQDFIESRQGGGGTEMMTAIRTALSSSDEQQHIRIVCFLTDGYVGNDMAILGEVQKHPNARVFSFGVGNSVNRFLLDKMAEVSRGEVSYVTLSDDGSAAARRFHERIRNPLLTDVSIDWGGLPVSDVYPQRIPDLFTAKPVVVSGRYTGPARGSIRLEGMMSGQKHVRTITVDLPAREPARDVLATLWARRKVDDLMSHDWAGVQSGNPSADVREAITKLGLDYRLMTQFTSFVAVEETIVTEGGQPRRVDVPVELPDGLSYEGIFGAREESEMAAMPQKSRMMIGRSASNWSGSGVSVTPEVLRGRVGGFVPAPTPAVSVKDAEESGGAKVHPDLVTLASGQAVPGLPTRDGKVAVEIWLVEASPQTVARLAELGFEKIEETRIAKLVIGWLPLAKLTEAGKLDGVRWIAPHHMQ